MSSMRQLLRDLPVLKGRPPAFDLDSAPGNPLELFTEWLQTAMTAGVQEPHAMTLSTVDEIGAPDARILILKDMDENGLYFAGSANSGKGRQLTSTPGAALTFYWPQLARQIRIRGSVVAATREAAKSDFLARSPSARVIAAMGRQSQIMTKADNVKSSLQEAETQIEKFPDKIPDHWRLYILAPKTVEFFQASEDRLNLRLRYDRSGTGWDKTRLWP